MSSNETTPLMINKRRLKAPKSTTKKPKFLSLRLQFPPDETKKTRRLSHMRQTSAAAAPATSSHQLNLFPLHPQNQVEDRDSQEHENVAYFFSAPDGGATTLTGLLNNATASNISSHSALDSCRQEESEERAALVRNALRSRERESSEERWVCYSKVVETKVKEEEVTSSVVDLRPAAADGAGIQRLSLKLDYDGILSAWSDKSPLYIHAESSQIVPDIITYHFPTNDVSNNGGISRECNVGAWEVPELITEKGETRLKNGEELKMGRREASVLRYKAKREKRLFSKKVRYQVRKLNAEKRPRIKGRFVKRS